jgi:hypothetical protein
MWLSGRELASHALDPVFGPQHHKKESKLRTEPSTWEAKAGLFRVPSQPGLHSYPLSQKQNNTKIEACNRGNGETRISTESLYILISNFNGFLPYFPFSGRSVSP